MHMDVSHSQMFAVSGANALKSYSETASISQTELHRIMGDHQRFLARQRGTRAKLQRAKLDGMIMARRDLSEADLSGASLVGANLVGADLSRASLYCADLTDCDLRYARLEQADLRGASFKGANLSHAIMDFADLRAATMLHMGDALVFQGNAHDEAPFGAVDFTGSSLRNVSFRNAKLDNANFTDALLQGAVFRGARLRNACFRGAVVANVHLEELMVSSMALKHSLGSPTRAAQERAKQLWVELKAHNEWFVSEGKRGKIANVDGEDLRPLGDALKGMCLAGLSARNAIAVSMDFSGCELQAARFDGTDLRGSSFADADLSGASFEHAKLNHAGFRNARIQDLRLCNGQMLFFRADTALGLKDQFNDANIHADAFMDEMGMPPANLH